MALNVVDLNLRKLDQHEIGQLPERLQKDIENNIDKSTLTDAGLNSYLGELQTAADTYNAGVGQDSANDYTDKVFQSDESRDKDYSAFKNSIYLAAQSDVPEEVDAAESLLNMLAPFGDVPRLNYESETNVIDNILVELAKPKYAAHVATIAIDKYVKRLQKGNDAFKQIFGTRVSDEVVKPVYNQKLARKKLQTTYLDTVEYVLAMAKNPKSPNPALFQSVLNVINISRKYYAAQYANRGKGKGGNNASPTTPTNPTT